MPLNDLPHSGGDQAAMSEVLSVADVTALGKQELPTPVLEVIDVRLVVEVGKPGEREVLRGINHCFNPGELTAIMGPSGAGKTTLLNIMLLNIETKNKLLDGRVLLGGKPITVNALRKYCAIVPQDDILLPSLSPRETLLYTAELRMRHASRGKRTGVVDAVLEALKLNHCQNTPVGSTEKRGISGGERRRVSIGMELVSNPSVLFLDEPTSGLDSKSAEDVVSILRGLVQGGRTIVSTIHQPSWLVFNAFDVGLFLKSGHVVYDNSPEHILEYFSKLPGAMVWRGNENPVDYVMREVQNSNVDIIANIWKASEEGRAAVDKVGKATCTDPELDLRRSALRQHAITHFRVLLKRNMYDFMKDRDKLFAQCLMKLSVGFLIGVCWWGKASPPAYGKTYTVTSALFMLITNCVFDNLFSTVLTFPTMRAMLRREYKNGTYSIIAWFSAYIMSIIIYQSLFCVLLSVPIYWFVGLRTELSRIIIFGVCILLCSCIGSVMGISIGAISKEVMDANQNVMPTVVPLFLFSGFIIPYPDIPWCFRFAYHISMYQMGFSILRINQFDGLILTDCALPNGYPLPPEQCTGRAFLQLADTHADPDQMSLVVRFACLSGVFFVMLLPAFALAHRKASERTG